jgi:biopolymer transport protein ExbD
MKTFNSRRQTPELNASSMADIAFLLLIFFLVSTTMDVEKGIFVKLPALSNEPPPPYNERNILSLKINFSDELMVEGEHADLMHLRGRVKEFILNPNHRGELAESPLKAVVSLQNDRSTSYAAYVSVYNEVKGAYNDLWNNEAKLLYSSTFKSLSKKQQKDIRSRIPLLISEGELLDLQKQ